MILSIINTLLMSHSLLYFLFFWTCQATKSNQSYPMIQDPLSTCTSVVRDRYLRFRRAIPSLQFHLTPGSPELRSPVPKRRLKKKPSRPLESIQVDPLHLINNHVTNKKQPIIHFFSATCQYCPTWHFMCLVAAEISSHMTELTKERKKGPQ